MEGLKFKIKDEALLKQLVQTFYFVAIK